MAFTRKFLRALLDEFKSSEAPDTDAIMDKILAEHGASITTYKGRLEKYDELDLDAIKRDQDELSDLKKKLGTLKIDDVIGSYNALTTQLGNRKLEDVLAQNEQYHKQVEEATKNKAIDELVKGYKFTSSAAERDIRQQIAAMPMSEDGKTFKDSSKIMEKLVADNADAFISGNKPPMFSSNIASGTSNSADEQSAFLKKYYKL